MRLLTVTHFFSAHGGGIERVAGQLCRRMAEKGAVSIWAASDCDELPSSPIQFVPLRCVDLLERLTGLPMPLPLPSAVGALRDAVRSCDAVIIHDALYASSVIAMITAKFEGKRTILVQHIASIPFASRIMRLLMKGAIAAVVRPMLRAADEVVFISDTVRQELAEPESRPSHHLLFNGVDQNLFNWAPPDAQGAGRPLLFVGRYVEKKGLAVLRALATQRPDLQIRMAGAGPIAPRDWGLGNVTDLGMLSPQQLASEYRNAAMLVLPSVGEGYPLVIQEAMACGLPVICGKPTDHADPEAAAWLHGVEVDLADPVTSARSCSDAIDAVSAASPDRAALAAFAAERYDWDRMTDAILRLCQPATAER